MRLLKSQSGFTMIELVVVIVILGILAAFAVPQFANLRGEARAAAVNGLSGGVRSAVGVSKVKYQAVGNMAATTVDLDGNSVTVAANTGIPAGSAAGIGTALQDTSGFTIDYTTPTAVTFRPSGGSATCQASYNGTTGVVTTTVTSC